MNYWLEIVAPVRARRSSTEPGWHVRHADRYRRHAATPAAPSRDRGWLRFRVADCRHGSGCADAGDRHRECRILVQGSLLDHLVGGEQVGAIVDHPQHQRDIARPLRPVIGDGVGRHVKHCRRYRAPYADRIPGLRRRRHCQRPSDRRSGQSLRRAFPARIRSDVQYAEEADGGIDRHPPEVIESLGILPCSKLLTPMKTSSMLAKKLVTPVRIGEGAPLHSPWPPA